MKIIWHIIRKDLRRLWPWLALIVGAMTARYVNFYAPHYLPEHIDLMSLWKRTEIVDNLLLGLGLFGTAIASAMLVHEDAVTGQRAFWFTRPISGARLLIAKILTLTFVIILAPIAVQLSWWLFQRHSGPDFASHIPLFFRQAGIAFVSFGFALLTRNLGSFLLSALITSFAVIFSHYVVVAQWLGLHWRSKTNAPDLVELYVAFIALCACVVHQYLTRHTHRTLVVFGGSFALCLAIFACWSWDEPKLTSRFDYRPWLPRDFVTKASITAPVPVLHTYRETPRRGNQPEIKTLSAFAFDLTLDPVPAGHWANILKATFPKETRLGLRYGRPVALQTPSYPHNYTTTDTLLIFQEGQSSPEIPAPINLILRFELRHPEIAARLPLESNASGALRSQQIRIAAIQPFERARDIAGAIKIGQKFGLILDETLPVHLASVDGSYAEGDNDYFHLFTETEVIHGEGNSRHAYFLASRHHSTVIPAESVTVSASLTVDGVRRRLIQAEFPIRLNEADLPDYELIKVVAPLVGLFERTVTLPAMRWATPQSTVSMPAR